MITFKKRVTSSEESSSFALSFADMTLVMFCFFVMLVAIAPEDDIKEMRPQIAMEPESDPLKAILPRINDILGIDLGSGSDEEKDGGKSAATASTTATEDSTEPALAGPGRGSGGVSISLEQGDYSRGSSQLDGKGNGLASEESDSKFDGGEGNLTHPPGKEQREVEKGIDLKRRLPKPLIGSVMDGGDLWEADLAGEEVSILLNMKNNIFTPGDFYLTGEMIRTMARLNEALSPYQHLIDITIIGHADSSPVRISGRIRSNRGLSFLRAEAVTDYIVKRGFDPAAIAVTGADSYQRHTRSVSILIKRRTVTTEQNPAPVSNYRGNLRME